jgi:hypothetical protein
MKVDHILHRGTCTLDEAKYKSAVEMLHSHFRIGTTITNRQLRTLTGITYDQAIRCLGRMCAEGILQRRGRGGGIHYVRLSESSGQGEEQHRS